MTNTPRDFVSVPRETLHAKFEAWARLPILNLNLATYPALKGQIGGRATYQDPTTEIARAAWYAGAEAPTPQPPTIDDIDRAVIAVRKHIIERDDGLEAYRLGEPIEEEEREFVRIVLTAAFGKGA